MEEYTLSEKIKCKIINLPKFRTDVHNINSIANLKESYGICAEETILAYRVIPKLFATIQKGGTVLTDQGIYRKLTSGLLKSDYVQYSVKYVDFPKYFPVLRLGTSERPQLINLNETLWFWYEALMENEPNEQLFFIMCEIRDEVIASSNNAKQEHKKICEEILENVTDCLLKEKQLNSKQIILLNYVASYNTYKEQAYCLKFQDEFQRKCYRMAFSFMEDEVLKTSEQFMKNVHALIEDYLSNEHQETTSSDMELYCHIYKMPEYTKRIVEKMIIYNLECEKFEEISILFQEFTGTDHENVVKNIIDKSIMEKIREIQIKCSENTLLEGKEIKLLEHMMFVNNYTKMCAETLVDYYLQKEEFQNAYALVEKVKEKEELSEYAEVQQKRIKDVHIKYAEKVYQQAKSYLEEEDYASAIKEIVEAIRIDNTNTDYYFLLFTVENKLGLYAELRSDIGGFLKYDILLSDEQKEQLKHFKAAANIGLDGKMASLYQMVKSEDMEMIASMSDFMNAKDQMGLGVYHYAVILGKDMVLEKLISCANDKELEKIKSTLLLLAVNDEVENYNKRKCFEILMGIYDEDVIEQQKIYKLEERKMKVQIIPFDMQIRNVDMELKHCRQKRYEAEKNERDSQCSDYERIVFQNQRKQLREEETKLLRERSEIQREKEKMETEVRIELCSMKEAISELCKEKKNEYKASIQAVEDYDSFYSKLLHELICKPAWLETIFYGEKEKFVLVEADRTFWYLPEAFIREAEMYETDSD